MNGRARAMVRPTHRVVEGYLPTRRKTRHKLNPDLVTGAPLALHSLLDTMMERAQNERKAPKDVFVKTIVKPP